MTDTSRSILDPYPCLTKAIISIEQREHASRCAFEHNITGVAFSFNFITLEELCERAYNTSLSPEIPTSIAAALIHGSKETVLEWLKTNEEYRNLYDFLCRVAFTKES